MAIRTKIQGSGWYFEPVVKDSIGRVQVLHVHMPPFSPRADTWRWPLGWFTLRARYDHIFYNDDLYALSASETNVGRSDHLSVIGKFALSEAMFAAQAKCRTTSVLARNLESGSVHFQHRDSSLRSE